MLVINHDQEKDWIFVVNEKEKNEKEKSAVSRLRNPMCFLMPYKKTPFN